MVDGRLIERENGTIAGGLRPVTCERRQDLYLFRSFGKIGRSRQLAGRVLCGRHLHLFRPGMHECGIEAVGIPARQPVSKVSPPRLRGWNTRRGCRFPRDRRAIWPTSLKSLAVKGLTPDPTAARGNRGNFQAGSLGKPILRQPRQTFRSAIFSRSPRDLGN